MSEPAAIIAITLNGERHECRAGDSVADLLAALAVPSFGVAVERNRAVVRRADHATTPLLDGDCIEIVHFVGGG